MVNEWTRDDLPSPKSVERSAEDNGVWITSYDAEFVLDAVVAHLNAHHPKPDDDDEGDTFPVRLRRQANTIAELQGVVNSWRRAHEIVELERDEWKARADKWHGAWQKSAPSPTVTRDDIDRALINVTSNAMNYPTPAQILGKDTESLRRKCVDAICDLLCIEADQGVDPVEAGQALWGAVWGHRHPPSAWFEIGQGLREEYALIEAHIAGQGDRHVDQ